MRRETTLTIPPEHPAFAGHFPGMPVVPGVVLLDAALYAIQCDLGIPAGACRIAAVKFLHPVGPGATLIIRHKTLDNGCIQFEILDGPTKVASGHGVVPIVGASPGAAA